MLAQACLTLAFATGKPLGAVLAGSLELTMGLITSKHMSVVEFGGLNCSLQVLRLVHPNHPIVINCEGIWFLFALNRDIALLSIDLVEDLFQDGNLSRNYLVSLLDESLSSAFLFSTVFGRATSRVRATIEESFRGCLLSGWTIRAVVLKNVHEFALTKGGVFLPISTGRSCLLLLVNFLHLKIIIELSVVFLTPGGRDEPFIEKL